MANPFADDAAPIATLGLLTRPITNPFREALAAMIPGGQIPDGFLKEARAISSRAVSRTVTRSRLASRAEGSAGETSNAPLKPGASLEFISPRPVQKHQADPVEPRHPEPPQSNIEITVDPASEPTNEPSTHTQDIPPPGTPIHAISYERGTAEKEYSYCLKEIANFIVDLFNSYVHYKELRPEDTRDQKICQCSADCTDIADVSAKAYGREENPNRIPAGFYDVGHLVDLFIDAYDAENELDEKEQNNNVIEVKRVEDGVRVEVAGVRTQQGSELITEQISPPRNDSPSNVTNPTNPIFDEPA